MEKKLSGLRTSRYTFPIVFMVLLTFTAATQAKYHPMTKGDAAPYSGILMDEETAAEMAAMKIELRELKAKYAVDLKVWNFKSQNTELIIEAQQERIDDLEKKQSSWWHQNKGAVGFVLGFTIAAILIGSTIGISVNIGNN